MTFEILVHDSRVATLHMDEGGQWVTDWAPTWVDGNPRLTVSLKLLDLRLNRPRSWGTRLPPFLTNLLPEVDSALRRRLARTHGVPEEDDVAFLSLLGGDLSGAIRVLPTDAPVSLGVPRPPPAEVALSGYRASLGGMQLKFSAHRRDHVTLPAHGELSEWILKLPASDHPRLPAWEAAALSWANAVGFDVPEHHVEPISRVSGLPDDVQRSVSSCLVVRRFDRPGGEQRVHMEEAASILGVHPEAKYGPPHNLTNVGRAVRQFAGAEAASLFVERVVFDAVMGNGDAHLKNWALLFPDGYSARLAPVYDLVPTTVFLGDTDLALPLHGSRAPRPDQVRPHEVRDFARRIGLEPESVVARAADLVHRAVASFDAAVEPWGLSADDLRDWRAHAARVASAWK